MGAVGPPWVQLLSCWKGFFICASPCCCSQPAPHQGPGAQAVGGAAARDRGPADHRGKAAAQRQLVSGDSVREAPTLVYFASLKDFELFLTYNKVTEQNRHQRMTCGIAGNGEVCFPWLWGVSVCRG